MNLRELYKQNRKSKLEKNVSSHLHCSYCMLVHDLCICNIQIMLCNIVIL